MPAKSKAQLAYLNAAAARGDVPQSVADEYNRTSKGKKLPARVKPKTRGKR